MDVDSWLAARSTTASDFFGRCPLSRIYGLVRYALGLAVGGVLIWFVFRGVEGSRVDESLRSADWFWLAGAVLFLAAHYPVKALRWRLLLHTRTRVPFRLVFQTMMVGFLVNDLVPLRAGDFSRPYLLATNSSGVPFSFAFSTAIAAKVLDLFFIAILFLVSAVLIDLPDWLETTIAVTGGTVVVGFVVALAIVRTRGARLKEAVIGLVRNRIGIRRSGRWEAVLAGLFDGILSMADRRILVRLLLVSAVSVFLMLCSVACILQAVHVSNSLVAAIVVLAMMHVAFALPAPPTFAGNLHYFVSNAVLLSGVGDLSTGLSVGVFVHLVEMVVLLPLGFVCIPGLRLRRAGAPSKGT